MKKKNVLLLAFGVALFGLFCWFLNSLEEEPEDDDLGLGLGSLTKADLERIGPLR